MNRENRLTKENNNDKTLETALNYAKFEALQGLAVQLLSVLSNPDRKTAWKIINKKIKEFSD